MYNPNLLLLTDSYKVTHWKQYPKDTEKVYSYFESRGGDLPFSGFFGLQYYLKEYLSKPITRENIDDARALYRAHFGEDLLNVEGWEYILKEHKGYLPVEIKAVPEGSIIPTNNVLMTIVNTDPKCYWLTNYLETILVHLWYGSTIQANSKQCRETLLAFLKQTGDESLIDFKLHDFGFRGVSSVETAAIGGAAHLLNFKGTDTVIAMDLIRKYYNDDFELGFSIPASEHSVMTIKGEEGEKEQMERMLDQYPTGLVACVSDSYNIFRACRDYWGTDLKDKVMNRNGTLVVRPDSGNPCEVVMKVIEILGQKFGYENNSKGYKVLDPHVRIIQGDGIDRETLTEICTKLMTKQWSIDNIAFGSGGGLLQKFNRDTLKFAFKCSAVKRDGTWYNVKKNPITDSGKSSKAGRLQLIKTDRGIKTARKGVFKDMLQTVYRNGKIIREHMFDKCRERSCESNIF